MTDVSELDSARSWRVLVGCALVLGFSFGAVWGSTLGLFLRPLQAELGWSRADIAFAMTLQLFIGPVVVVVLGWLVDRLPLRPLVAVGVVLQAANIAAFSLVGGSVWTFYGLVILIIFFGAGPSPITLSKIAQGWFDRRMGTALGVLFGAASAGSIVHPLIAARLIEALGWRQAYVALGGISLLFAGLATALLVRERLRRARRPAAVASAAARAPTPHKDGVFDTFKLLLRQRNWWLLSLWNMLFAYGVAGIAFHLAPMLQDRGVSATQSAFALSFMGAGLLVGNLTIGWLLDRFRPRWLAAGLNVLPIAAMALLYMQGGLPVALLAAVMMGLSSGSDGALSAYLPRRLFGPEIFGQAYSSQVVASALGGGTAPWLVALMHERSGSYDLPLALAVLAFMGTAVTALLLPRSLDRREADSLRVAPGTAPAA
jgi:MFS family permease